MRNYRLTRLAFAAAAPLGLTLLMGAQGDGCAANSQSPAPDVTGAWDVTYDDTIGVEITIGGAVYDAELGAQGGTVTIDHEGHPITFDLDCARPDILCPSEAWPRTVTAEQRDAAFEHRMIVTLPTQQCSGQMVAPDASACGAGTDNPDCDSVCDGDVTVRDEERFGVIGENGSSFRLYLGAGLATNGINCVLFGWSVADATLDTTGGASTGDWEATGMSDGLVEIGYAGGCLWAGDPDDDGTIEALALGASIKFTTGFTAARQ
jgi:hypothetical protein